MATRPLYVTAFDSQVTRKGDELDALVLAFKTAMRSPRSQSAPRRASPLTARKLKRHNSIHANGHANGHASPAARMKKSATESHMNGIQMNGDTLVISCDSPPRREKPKLNGHHEPSRTLRLDAAEPRRKAYRFVDGQLEPAPRWNDLATCRVYVSPDDASPSHHNGFCRDSWSIDNVSEPARFTSRPLAFAEEPGTSKQVNGSSTSSSHPTNGELSKFELPKRPPVSRTNLNLSFGGSSTPKRSRQVFTFGCPTMLNGAGEEVDTTLPFKRQGWYHGHITRVEAENLLRSRPEGSYLVRRSDKQGYSLSLKSARGFMHMKISNQNGKFSICSSRPFASIPELVRHFTLNKLPIRGADYMSLRHPVIEPLL